jgi:hypothetical protein
LATEIAIRRAAGRSPSRGGAVALLALAAAPLGCAHYEPTVPMRARSADVVLDLQYVAVGGGRQIAYRAHADAPHVIRHAWLTVPTRAPCSGGAAADALDVDGRPSPTGELPAGDHDVRVKLDSNAEDFALDVVVDMEVDEGVCLRAPAVSQSLPMSAPRRLVAVGTMDLAGNSELSGLSAIYDAKVGLGAWLGPVLLTAEAGIGGATCKAQLCGREPDNSLRTGLAIPATLGVRVSPGAGIRNRVVSVAFVGARYAFASVGLPAPEGDRRFATHALQGVVGWAIGDGTRGPFTHLERGPLYEMAFPIGVVWAPDAPAEKVAFAAAFELRFLLPL